MKLNRTKIEKYSKQILNIIFVNLKNSLMISLFNKWFCLGKLSSNDSVWFKNFKRYTKLIISVWFWVNWNGLVQFDELLWWLGSVFLLNCIMNNPINPLLGWKIHNNPFLSMLKLYILSMLKLYIIGPS